MKRRLWTVLSVILALVGVFAFAACGDVEEPIEVEGPEAGVYYFEADGTEYTVSLEKGNHFTLVLASGTYTGTYVIDNGSLTLSVDGGKSASATLSNELLTLTFEGSTYRFYLKKEYTVTFDAMGGSAVSPQSVMNGKTAQRPQEPTKSGEVFVGWYRSSEYSELYDFATPVTGNITLYARYVEPLDPEFIVTFNVDGGNGGYDPVQTKGRGVYELPTPSKAGSVFVGWWMSDYEDAGKLTCQYTGQTLGQNTTLYAVWETAAPAVSVNASGISWTAKGGLTASYTLIVTLDGENVVNQTVNATSYAYDFAQKDAGEYEVSVTYGNNTGKAFYKNKTLNRVSVFSVEGDTLLFNAVPNAESYLLQIECGTPSHHNAPIELTEPKYDFHECDMKEGGIVFTVTAQANGWLSSVSAPYSYERTLEGVQNLKIDAETETVTWTAVKNASSYVVTVTVDGAEVYSGNVGNVTSFDLKTYAAGKVSVKVSPKALGWFSPAPAEAEFTKTRLAAPKNLHLETNFITWDTVAGATGYEVTVGTHKTTVNTNRFDFPTDFVVEGQSEYTVTVRALDSTDDNKSSLVSDPLTVHYGTMGETLTYRNGYVSWDGVLGAKQFVLKINEDGEEQVFESTTSAPVTFTESGTYTIYVRAVYDDENKTDWISTTVEIYELSFDTLSDLIVDSFFLAKGDTIPEKPEVVQGGYTLSGWYTLPENGMEYDFNAPFNESANRTLYAKWTVNQYTITFNLNNYGIPTDELNAGVKVTFHETYKLPVPETSDTSRSFVGWFSDAGGTQQYTDAEGNSLAPYGQASDIQLYARWVVLFDFTPTADGKGYSVSQNANITIYGLTEVTIPVKYNNQYVVNVVDFTKCTTLVKINIPDTIQNILMAATENAFTGCSKLQEVNIYTTDVTNMEKPYSSVDGVLLYQNKETGNKELRYYPYAYARAQTIPATDTEAKQVVYTVPSGVQAIPSYVFSYVSSSTMKDLTTIYLPATVRLIEAYAFDNFTSTSLQKLSKIAFLEPQEGEQVSDLELRPAAFNNVKTLKELYLPSHMKDFNYSEALVSATALTKIGIVGTGGAYSSVGDALCRNTNNVLELVYYPSALKEFTLPEGVTRIGAAALKNNAVITSITIPASVTEIGKEAFYGCTKVTKIEFLGTKTDQRLTIRESAFYGCSNSSLKEVVLPENLIVLESYAFGNTKIATVTVNSDCDTFGALSFADGAFIKDMSDTSTSSSATVTKVILGAHVRGINFSGVFGDKLTSIEGIETNSYYVADETYEGVIYTCGSDSKPTGLAFYPSTREGEYVIPDGITEIPAGFFRSKNISVITIPDTVKLIGDRAFQSCEKLTEVKFTGDSTETELTIGNRVFFNSEVQKITFPERLVSMGQYVFASCTALTELYFPSTLASIGATVETTVSGGTDMSYATFFPSSSTCKLKITVAENNNVFGVYDDALYLKKQDPTTGAYYNSELIWAPTGLKESFEVTDTVEKIWMNAFGGENTSAKLKTVTFKNNQLAPMGDGSARSLVIAFKGFNAPTLTSLTLPKGLTSLSTYAIYNCGLTSLTIPNTVTSVAGQALYNSLITNLVFEDGDIPLRIEDNFAIPSISTYTPQKYWGLLADKTANLKELTLPSRLVYIGNGAFCCSGLSELTIPYSVQTIGAFAFAGQTNMSATTSHITKLTFESSAEHPSQLTYIGDFAFELQKMETLTIPASVVTICAGAFSQGTTNSNLQTVKFEDNSRLESLGVYGPKNKSTTPIGVFENNTGLTSVDFGKNSALKEINTKCFNKAPITSISLPSSIEFVKDNVFSYTSLEEFTFETDEEGKSHLRQLGTIFGTSVMANIKLNEFTLPESYNEIVLPTGFFTALGELDQITLSSSVVDLNNVLKGINVKKIVIAENNPVYKSDPDQPIIYSKKDNSVIFVYGAIEGVVTISEGAQLIGENAFAGQKGITKVILPQSLVTIGLSAFQACDLLEEVVVPTNCALTSIGQNAFYECGALKTFNFRNTSLLQSIGATAFSKTGLVVADLSKTRLEMLVGVFTYCSDLEEIYFPNSLNNLAGGLNENPKLKAVDLSHTQITKLGVQGGFKNDRALASVLLPDGITFINQQSFMNCSALETIDLSRSTIKNLQGSETVQETLTAPSSTFSGCTSLREVKVPSTLTHIGKEAFKDCNSLTTIDMTNFIIIGQGAFQNCGFTELTLPKHVTSWPTGKESSKTVPTGVFAGCDQIETLTMPADMTVPTSGFPDAFFYRVGMKHCVIEEGLELTINSNFFCECTRLEDITLPASVKSLVNTAFKGCTALQKADLSKLSASIDKIPSNFFEGCTSLNNVILSDSIVQISSNSFKDCTGLASTDNIKGFDHVTRIDANAFQNTGLTSFGIKSGVTYGAGVLMDCAQLQNVTIDAGITTIPNKMFQNCTKLASIDIPQSVTHLGTETFSGSGLKSIDLSKTGVTRFGNGATATFNQATSISLFKDCAQLTKVVLPENFEYIGANTFENCVLLSDINVKVKQLGNSCFAGCVALTADRIDWDSLTVIGSKTFQNCTGITGNITVKATTLGANCFDGTNITEFVDDEITGTSNLGVEALENCAKLQYASFARITKLPNYTFRNCIALERYNLPSITEIGEQAFSGCVSLTYFKAEKVTKVGNSAFAGCTELKAIELPLVTSLGNNTFDGCGVEELTLGELTSLGTSAFKGTKIKSITLNKITNIGANMFEDSALEFISAPAVTSIGTAAFKNTTKLKTALEFPKLTTIAANAFEGSAITGITAPLVTTINKEAFKNATNLTGDLRFEKLNSTGLAESCFENTAITSFYIPSTLWTSYGTSTNYGLIFKDCMQLKKFEVADGHKTVAYDEATGILTITSTTAAYGKALVTYARGAVTDGNTTLTIPADIHSIGRYAFAGHNTYTAINFSEGLYMINLFGFRGTQDIDSLTLPKSLEVVSQGAFQEAEFTSITFQSVFTATNTGVSGNTTLTESSDVFRDNTHLTNLVLPEGLIRVGSNWFNGCTSLKSLHLPDTITTYESNCFIGNSLEEINIPAATTDLPNHFGNRLLFVKQLVIPSTVMSIVSTTFDQWSADQKICCVGSREEVIERLGDEWINATKAQVTFDYKP